jgi:MFS family permease
LRVDHQVLAYADEPADMIKISSAARDAAPTTALVFANVLSGTLLIPAVRPFFAAVAPGHEGGMHAFMALNMLGAVLGAPLFARLADRTGAQRFLAMGLAVLDAELLLAMAFAPSVGVILALRLVQGATNLAALSLLLSRVGTAPRAASGGAFGAAAGVMIAAVAAGSPVGTFALGFGARAPLLAAAFLMLVVAAGSWAWAPPATPRRVPRLGLFALARRAPLVRAAAVWLGVERFAVGGFVVTFSVYAHERFWLSNAAVGALFSAFVVPFALASFPLGRLADVGRRAEIVAAGLLIYGCCFIALAAAPLPALAPVLVLTGLASAAIYGPSLCLAATATPSFERATAMALVNAAGCLGMLLGTATAGVVAVSLRAAGWSWGAHRAVLALVGFVVLGTLLLTRRGVTAASLASHERDHSTARGASPSERVLKFPPAPRDGRIDRRGST